MGPIGSKVIEVKGQIYVFFCWSCFCLICLHRRNHLTATSRRVKFTSVVNGHEIINVQTKGGGNGSKIMATKIMAIMKWGKGLLYAINLDHVHRLCSVDPDKSPESRITVESYYGFHAHYC